MSAGGQDSPRREASAPDSPAQPSEAARTTFMMPVARVINRALHVMINSREAQVSALHTAVAAGVAALLLAVFRPLSWGAWGGANAACVGTLCVLQAALAASYFIDYRSHQTILDTLGWDGWDIRVDPQDPYVDRRLRIALVTASDTYGRTLWWQGRLSVAIRIFTAASILSPLAGIVTSIVDRAAG